MGSVLVSTAPSGLSAEAIASAELDEQIARWEADAAKASTAALRARACMEYDAATSAESQWWRRYRSGREQVVAAEREEEKAAEVALEKAIQERANQMDAQRKAWGVAAERRRAWRKEEVQRVARLLESQRADRAAEVKAERRGRVYTNKSSV
jgi:hypothetical protein